MGKQMIVSDDIKILGIIVTIINILISVVFLTVGSNKPIEYHFVDSAGALPGHNAIVSENREGSVLDITSEELTEADDSDEYAKTLGSFYLSRLELKTFSDNNGLNFYFGLAGNYNGFFDSNNKYVSGYNYDVAVIDDKTVLTICNETYTVKISYVLTFEDDCLMLYYAPANVTLKLYEQ